MCKALRLGKCRADFSSDGIHIYRSDTLTAKWCWRRRVTAPSLLKVRWQRKLHVCIQVHQIITPDTSTDKHLPTGMMSLCFKPITEYIFIQLRADDYSSAELINDVINLQNIKYNSKYDFSTC